MSRKGPQIARFAYEPDVDIATLAACYSFDLTRNHPFDDGNKRISFHAAGLFSLINGYRLIVKDNMEAIRKVLDLAAGTLKEEEFAAWIRKHLSMKLLDTNLSGPDVDAAKSRTTKTRSA